MLKQVELLGRFQKCAGLVQAGSPTPVVTVSSVQQCGIRRTVILPQDMLVAYVSSTWQHNPTAAGNGTYVAAVALKSPCGHDS